MAQACWLLLEPKSTVLARGLGGSGGAGLRCRSAVTRIKGQSEISSCAPKSSTHHILEVGVSKMSNVSRQVLLLEPLLLRTNVGRLDTSEDLGRVLDESTEHGRPRIDLTWREAQVEVAVGVRELGGGGVGASDVGLRRVTPRASLTRR